MVETILNSGFFWGILGIVMVSAIVLMSNKEKKPVH